MDRDPFCCIFPIPRAFLLDVPMQLTGPALPAGLCPEIPRRKAISYISLHHVVNTSSHDAMSHSLFTSLLLSPCGSWVERKLEKTFPHPQPKRVLFPQLSFCCRLKFSVNLPMLSTTSFSEIALLRVVPIFLLERQQRSSQHQLRG